MSSVQRSADTASLAEVIDCILDKGIVIDAYVRVSVVGIEILTIEARIVIASVDTWLRYAEAVGLLRDEVEEEGLPGQSQEQLASENQSRERIESDSQSKEADKEEAKQKEGSFGV
ncbi:gas vesicle protein GvpJ [Staphylococcus hyicus]|uniref:Gas vesicle protein GvpJ n=1 Tax=Staphylococcus hyicus TaxID=1284 RepID=A0ACD5FKB7_STAHY|nr:gas vesicle protein GvpJ [Staphylococcus hyicus]MCE5154196.1 gas vesicle structural protein GvpA [Staphylococcus hyicus]MDP4460652.1 gas vesicle protein GvpJ [Staphylococcus hyicus]MDP4464159.1 gas vesicle protein GvpJ [Staphylococcus hyicus]MDY3697577.1 gas vesicle protein GvpJ [Staphylococcus hyicus]